MENNNQQNSENNTNTSEVVYNNTPLQYSSQENSAIPEVKKRKTPKFIKFIGSLLCVAAISAGSIAGYKYVDENGMPFSDKKETVSDSNEIKQLPVEEKSYQTSESTSTIDRTRFQESSIININETGSTMSNQSIYKKVLPSVVGITSVFKADVQSYDFWGFGNESTSKEVAGTGTGIVLSSDGYILTNAHVISDDDYGTATKITILMSDETEYEAEIAGYDKQTDIAVLKADIGTDELVAAEFGSSDNLRVGDPVLAIGNPLGFDLFGTLTAGYVSGLGREVAVNDNTMKLIQTDAAINSGNSGGPLINEYGQVIGINSMKFSNSYYSSYSNEASIEGLGFAIPIDDAKKIIDDLMAYGYVTGRPQLGITTKDLSDGYYSYYSQSGGNSGVLIVSVNQDGPADKVGIKSGDIIVGANEEVITNIEDLKAVINEHNAGDTIKLTIIRNRNYYNVDVVLEDTHPDVNQ